jgi:hypothetical protein
LKQKSFFYIPASRGRQHAFRLSLRPDAAFRHGGGIRPTRIKSNFLMVTYTLNDNGRRQPLLLPEKGREDDDLNEYRGNQGKAQHIEFFS